jgi:hypothetical protein
LGDGLGDATGDALIHLGFRVHFLAKRNTSE